jgi:uncharacterized OB-fold protein
MRTSCPPTVCQGKGRGTGLEIGSKVEPKFRALAKRQGTILDIEGFVKA